MPNSETVLQGRIENLKCHLRVAFGKPTPGGCVMRTQTDQTALDTHTPGITLPEAIARELGLEVEVPNIPPPGKRGSTWSRSVQGMAMVCYQIQDPAGTVVWEGEAWAAVLPVDRPTLGMGQIIGWKFSINGPKGEFEVRLPDDANFRRP